MNTPQSPVILWFRRDLRFADNEALIAAVRTDRPVIFLFIRDSLVDDMGACPKWRLGLSLKTLGNRLEKAGCQLVLRSGDALSVLGDVIAETGAEIVHYCRDYTPRAIARDSVIKSTLKAQNIDVNSHRGALLFEPWTVKNKTGGYFKVYTPFWKTVRDISVSRVEPEPCLIPYTPQIESETLEDWKLAADMHSGASVVTEFVHVGEGAAQSILQAFSAERIADYKRDRDRMDISATSGLSEHLTYGEVSPRQMWHAGMARLRDGAAGAEHFLKELVWREFAYHLLYHAPNMETENWKPGWDAFPWSGDNEKAEAWRRGETGEPVIDAAMRELYVTGRMHNRSRMIVASYLTKHLMVDWRIGMDWFAECLTDWDPASNAMGWQWVAGCGPDAAPFFRIFNPETQAAKFDPLGLYQARFLEPSSREASLFARAAPKGWNARADGRKSSKIVELKAGRERALAAHSAFLALTKNLNKQKETA